MNRLLSVLAPSLRSSRSIAIGRAAAQAPWVALTLAASLRSTPAAAQPLPAQPPPGQQPPAAVAAPPPPPAQPVPAPPPGPAVPAPAPAPAAPAPAPPVYAGYPYAGSGQYVPPGYGPQPALVLPAIIEDDGQPVPDGYSRVKKPRGALVLAGVGVLAPLYAFSVTAAIVSDASEDRWLFVPVLGPVVDLALRKGCGSSSSYCDDGARTILGMDFLGQATGALLFALGYAVPREVFVRNDALPAHTSSSGPKHSLPFLLVPGFIGGASQSSGGGRSPGVPGLSAAGIF